MNNDLYQRFAFHRPRFPQNVREDRMRRKRGLCLRITSVCEGLRNGFEA